MRRQNERFIVFDDPLALTVCHVNVIPTDTYMPDWRYAIQLSMLLGSKVFSYHRTCQLEVCDKVQSMLLGIIF
jgi:hypothetical protein